LGTTNECNSESCFFLCLFFVHQFIITKTTHNKDILFAQINERQK